MKSCNLRKQTLSDVKDMIYARLWEHRRLYNEGVCDGIVSKALTESGICVELVDILNKLDGMENHEIETN